MKCPYCSHTDTKVLDSRSIDNGKSIKRRRQCLNCDKRFNTFERYEKEILVIIKKDKTREKFSREKVFLSIMKPCEKRPISKMVLDEIVDRIEKDLFDLGMEEIPSSIVGDLICEELKKIDKVAYIRFAAVYRNFEDVSSIKKEIQKLEKEN